MTTPNSQFNSLQRAAYQLASCTDQLFQQIEQEQVLDEIIERIRSCLELRDVFETTATSLRQLLNADRVAVFQFEGDSDSHTGLFVSEDVRAEFPAALSVKIRDNCFGTQFAAHYTKGRIQTEANIYDAGLSDCHIEILERFQVKANLVVPVFKGEELWGLLCVHQCTGSRRWQMAEIEFVKKIAVHLAIALQQSDHLEQIKTQAALLAQTKAQEKAFLRQKSLVKLVSKIRRFSAFTEICNTATAEVRQLLEADRVTIYRFNKDWSGDFLFESVEADWQPLVGVAPKIEDTHLMETQGGRYAQGETFAIADIYTAGHSDCHIELLEQFQARAYAIAPIFQNHCLWGLITAFQNSGPRRWQTDEVELLAQVGEQLGIALQQANKQRKAINRQKALVKIVSKIRQSLELEEICHTATAEVRQLLEADRVVIYRFNPDWSGDFLFESVIEPWEALVGACPTVEDTHLMEHQGGRYANGETFAVADIYAAGHSDCHIELLEQFQAKAYSIAPIFQGDSLWGLLTAFQNSAPRRWQGDEIDLLAQVGEQLGIALQQTESVRQIQAQSRELEQVLAALKNSQMQMVQSEKMASLGQLVAGIAHEINNPVNFIHGNLPHVNDYVHDLLGLSRAYQQVNPDAPEDIRALQAKAEELDIDFILDDLPKVLSSMAIGTERICKLVLSLRNFSRLDEAAFKAVDLHAGIDSTLLILGHRLKIWDKKIDIEVLKDYGEIDLVECYPAQLNQVFMNILSNAIDAIYEAIEQGKLDISGSEDGRSPKIWITTEMEDAETVKISIRDNGIGINQDYATKLFDHFFTTKSIGQGTGIGLSIAYEIVTKKHHGTLDFTSSPNEGAEFVVKLPVKANDHQTIHNA